MVNKQVKSPKGSLKGWDVVELLKGQVLWLKRSPDALRVLAELVKWAVSAVPSWNWLSSNPALAAVVMLALKGLADTIHYWLSEQE